MYKRQALTIEQVNEDAKLCIAVVDVQNKWLSMNVWLFSDRTEGVMVDRQEFHGDVELVGSSAWGLCKEWLRTKPTYRGYGIKMLAIDTGYSSDAAVRNGMRMGISNTYFMKGAYGFNRAAYERAKRAKVQNIRHPLFIIGVDPLKQTVRRCLSNGSIRVLDTIPEAVDQELTSENLVRRRMMGKWVPRWEQVHERNEALDTLVYALAAIRIAGMNAAMIARIQPANAKRKGRRSRRNSADRLRDSGMFS